MYIKNRIKSLALAGLFILSFSAFCFLNMESQNNEFANEANLITAPVQENVPSLPDVKILNFIIENIKGGIVPGN